MRPRDVDPYADVMAEFDKAAKEGVPFRKDGQNGGLDIQGVFKQAAKQAANVAGQAAPILLKQVQDGNIPGPAGTYLKTAAQIAPLIGGGGNNSGVYGPEGGGRRMATAVLTVFVIIIIVVLAFWAARTGCTAPRAAPGASDKMGPVGVFTIAAVGAIGAGAIALVAFSRPRRRGL